MKTTVEYRFSTPLRDYRVYSSLPVRTTALLLCIPHGIKGKCTAVIRPYLLPLAQVMIYEKR